MAVKSDHNKLLKRIAKERLNPQGFFQIGNSRSFYWDNYWYTIIIEFQPSSFNKGTFLNIGVDFNFYPRAHFAYAYGFREKNFITFENETQFEKVIHEFCDLAINRTEELKQLFTNYNKAIETLESKLSPTDLWRFLDLAFINILIPDNKKAGLYLDKILAYNSTTPWVDDLKIFTRQFKDKLNSSEIEENVNALIDETRILKKLPKRK